MEKLPDTKFVLQPPPNETGTLHCGHFLMHTILDTIVRGMNIILNQNIYICPGVDHGGIAMQVAARRYYNISNPTYEEIFTLAKQYRENMQTDLKKWNISFDWSKNHYTMSDSHNKFVSEMFCKLYNAGYITQKHAMINWDTGFNTAISDLEVEMVQKSGFLYEIEYKTSLGDSLIISTTRPETIFADVCLMINPNDIDKQKYVGQFAYIPLINKQIPILSDEYVDINYGTGVLKVTPGHDINDAKLGEKYNLPSYNILNNQSEIIWSELNLTEEQLQIANKCLQHGNRIEEVRTTIVEILKCNTKPITHNVPISSRSQAPVEHCLKIQWFMNMQEASELALEANVELLPYNQFTNNMKNWLTNIHDWCLSRTSPWGHTIPAWYKDGNMVVGIECPGEGYIQTTEKLDTWFSSALWPLSYKNLFNIFPFNILVTGYDILFFWVARMIMVTLLIEKIDAKLNGIKFDIKKSLPFYRVYLHGLVRDEKNRKMSKTLNNIIEPNKEIELYTNEYNMNGCDLLRLSLLLQISPHSNVQMRKSLLRARNIITKLTNCCSFITTAQSNNIDIPSDLIQYFQGRLQFFYNKMVELTNQTILHTYVNEIIDFLYEVCDYLLEFYKIDNSLYDILMQSIKILLKCFSTLIPTTSDKLYTSITNDHLTSIAPLNYMPISKQHDLISLIQQLRILKSLNIKYYYNQKYANILRKLCTNYCDYSKDLKSIILYNYIIYIEISDINAIYTYIETKKEQLKKLIINDNMPESIKKEYTETINNINNELHILNNIINNV